MLGQARRGINDTKPKQRQQQKKEQLQILSPLVAEAKTAKLISIHNHIKGSESRSRMNY
jgi:hypothetical protein